MNYYPFHIGDYASATDHLTWVEDMAYTRILRLYYQNDGVIPSDIQQVCRRVRAKTKDECAAVETVLSEFFARTSDGWKNKRADEEISKYLSRANKNREHGKKGGRPPKPETQMVSENNPDGLQKETQMVSEKKPTKNQEPRTNNSVARGVVNYSSVARPEKNTPPPQLNEFPMTNDWVPDRKLITDLLAASGIVFDPFDLVTLTEFRGHWAATNEKRSHEKWHTTYLKKIVRDVQFKKIDTAKTETAMRDATGKNSNVEDTSNADFVTLHTNQNWRKGLVENVSHETLPARNSA